MNADISAALNRWIVANEALRKAISEELEARAALTWIAFPQPLDGTNNQPLPDGRVLQGTFKMNYNIDNKRVEEVLKQLPRPVASGLVSWNAKLKVGSYKALEPAHKTIFNEVLTISPARPALEIVEPKER